MMTGTALGTLRFFVIAWLIFIFTFGLFPLWAATMHLGLQDWDALAASYWNVLPTNESLTWASLFPNFLYRFLYNITDYRPFTQLWTNIEFIVALGKWWVFYLFQIIEILVCVWLLYAIATYFDLGLFGLAALLAMFLTSNKPQLPSILNDSYFITTMVLLIFFSLLRLTHARDVKPAVAADRQPHLLQYGAYFLFAVLLVLATFTREYVIAFTLAIIFFVHLYAIVRREPVLHAYMLAPWAAQIWLLYRLLFFSSNRQAKMGWAQFADRVRDFAIKLLPIRLDGKVSILMVVVLAAGVAICVREALRWLGPWLTRRYPDAAPVLLGAIAAGAIGMMLLVSIPNSMPTWSRYVVPSATLLTVISVIGLSKIQSGSLRRSAYIVIIVLTPLLALADRYHDQTMNVRYMWSINNMFHRLVNLQNTGARLFVDDGGTMFSENIYTIERFFKIDGGRFYHLALTPILSDDKILSDHVDDFYLVIRDRDIFDFHSIERRFPGYSIVNVAGFISDEPFGLDRLAALWAKVGQTLGQLQNPVDEYFWPDLARDPGYYLLHLVRNADGKRDFTGLTYVNISLSVPAKSAQGTTSLSTKFSVTTTGWYFICSAPELKVRSGTAYLMLQSSKGTTFLETVASGASKAVTARPFRLEAGDSEQIVASTPNIELRGHASLAICPLTVTRPVPEFGSLF